MILSRWRDAVGASAAYAAVTIVWTWPLAAGLAHDVPADFGDPLLNSWILAWDATHVGRGWWNANIFYPHPLALAYSEHLLPQALAILPIYRLTANPILCYNLVFLSTFVLSGLGMFLLARELTGSGAGAFIAGLAFAFAPYRVASLPHLQVLSSMWMPFALYGVRRYFAGGRPRALAGGAAAWLLQNLSCGYYLLFFTPVVLLYLAWELVARRPPARVAAAVAAAALAVAAATLPFATPYLELRRLGFGPRPIEEVVRFSADTNGYLTADPNARLWGPIARASQNPEGALFPGIVVTALAAATAARAFWPAALVLAPFLLLALPLFAIRLPLVRTTSLARTAGFAALASLVLLAASRRRRRQLRAWLGSPIGFFAAIVLLSAMMSFGPEVRTRGRTVAQGVVYTLFYEYVPGFDGLRVPARFAMIVSFGLAALAGYAIRSSRAAAAVGALLVVESLAVPLPLDQNDTNYGRPHLAALPARVSLSDSADLYGFVARLPGTVAIAELPLGEPAFDVRYMFYSTRHWKPLVNGYSGGAPEEYTRLGQDLQDALDRPDRAWQALVHTHATHVIVHEALYAEGRGPAITAWLRSRGARDVAAFGSDRVLVLN